MPAQVHADCPRCDNAVSSERPNCPRCGLWMPWGDDRVEQLVDELRASWAEVRRDPQSQALPLPTKSRQATPRTNWLAGLACGAVLGMMAILGVQVLVPSSEKRPSGICQDGSPTFAKSKSGACASHGGVREFYGR